MPPIITADFYRLLQNVIFTAYFFRLVQNLKHSNINLGGNYRRSYFEFFKFHVTYSVTLASRITAYFYRLM